MKTRNGWGQAPTAWDAPGWAPLVDPDSLPSQTARSVGRWLWFTVAVGGFLVVTGFVFAHDDPAQGLSVRGLVTITLAAAVVVLLTVRRAAGPGPLARALAEYAVVFLLATLVATTGIPIDQPPPATGKTSNKTAQVTPDQRPALIKTIDGVRNWLSEWRKWADKQTDHRDHAAPTSLAPPPQSSTRRPL